MALVGFVRNYTWLCAVGCFIVAMIFGANGMREKRAWVTSEARVTGFDDNCHMVPVVPPSEKKSVWGGVVPCAEVSIKKEQHSEFPYEVSTMRTFVLEYASPDGTVLQTKTTGVDLRLPQTVETGHHLIIDYAIAHPDILRSHERLRGLQIAILLNIFGLCLLGFAWLSHIAHGGQTTGAPTGDWLSNIDLPPESIAGHRAPMKRSELPTRTTVRAPPRDPRQNVAKAGGFGRKA